MLELAHFKQGDDAVEMIELAISKFQAALKIEPRKHDALWCLGNALTSQGFLFQEAEKACSYFDEAISSKIVVVSNMSCFTYYLTGIIPRECPWRRLW